PRIALAPPRRPESHSSSTRGPLCPSLESWFTLGRFTFGQDNRRSPPLPDRSRTMETHRRIHFLEDQQRNRGRSRRFGVFAITAVAIAGLPLCVVIAPLLLGSLVLIASVVDLFSPLDVADWAVLHDVIFVGPTLYRKLFGHESAISWRALAVLYLAPGAMLMLLAWPFVRLI